MIFTLFLWLLAALIYLSDRNNKANIWCAVNGVVFSLGTLKEYYYFDLVPRLTEQYGLSISLEFHTAVYSFMTAVLYYFALPTALFFVFYFCGYDHRLGRHFRWVQAGILLLALSQFLIYHPLQFSQYQRNDRIFWYVVTLYNVGYGILYTVLMLTTIVRETNTEARRQKRLVAILILPSLWFWLITIFVIHSLGIKELFKLWQGNTYIIAASLLFYIVMAFREGIMGIRLRRETYRWNTDIQMINKSAQYMGHLLKNETAKIGWCLASLRKKLSENQQPLPEEIEIIERSIDHLKNYNQKTRSYTDRMVLNQQKWLLDDLLTDSVRLTRYLFGEKITLHIIGSEHKKWMLYCDKTHMIEVLNNLIQNAVDAIPEQGCIEISCFQDKVKPYFGISVHDNGTGIRQESMAQLFEPYYTTKKNGTHFGLGLSYCKNVIKKHDGYIDVKSRPESGTTFTVYIPSRRISQMPEKEIS